MDIKVSVILTVYNTEKYLSECLDSILAQTIKEFELICIDDASKDASLDVLRKYKQNDDRLQIYTMQSNKGVSFCRNYGLEHAKGKYVIFLDSDDIFKLTMLQEMYANAEMYNSDIVICDSVKYDDLLDEHLYMKDSLRKDYLPLKNAFQYKDISDYVFNFCKGWAWDKLYLREFLLDKTLQFPDLRHTEDAVFVYKSLVLARQISVLDNILVVHRIRRKDSVSSSHDANVHDFKSAIELLEDFLIQNKYYHEVAKSFENWAVNLSIWFLNTLKIRENREVIYQYLHKELFKKIDKQGTLSRKADFYQSSDYRLYRWILNTPCSEKLLKKIKIYYSVTRGLKSLKENGLWYWIKRSLCR